MDVKDLLNAGFGVLNPIRDTLTGKNFDTSNAKPLDAMISSTEMSFSPNASLGTGPYIGVCLRVEGFLNEGAIDPTNTYTIVNESIRKNNESEAPRLLQIRVRIPEIHSALPIPQTLPAITEASTDHSVINLYPVFIAKDLMISSDTPQPGEMVWVDFQNTNTQEGPIYLGRVSNDTVVNGNSSTSGRISFSKSCTQSPAVTPPKTQEVKASNSSAVTNPIDMLNNAKKSYTPKAKQPAAQNSVSKCGSGAVGAGTGRTGNPEGEPKNYKTTGRKDYGPANDKYLGILDRNTGKRTKKIEMIVIHDGGAYGGKGEKGARSQVEVAINDWTPKSVSSHYYIELDGTVFQLVEEARMAYHTYTNAKKYGDPVTNVNSRSIGIDFGRCSSNPKVYHLDKDRKPFNCKSRGYTAPYTKQQHASLKKLLKDICRRQNIPYDEDHILGHAAITPKRRGDPTKGFKWSDIGLTAKYGPFKYGYKQCPDPSTSGKQKSEPKPVSKKEYKKAVDDAAQATGVGSILPFGGGS